MLYSFNQTFASVLLENKTNALLRCADDLFLIFQKFTAVNVFSDFMNCKL